MSMDKEINSKQGSFPALSLKLKFSLQASVQLIGELDIWPRYR